MSQSWEPGNSGGAPPPGGYGNVPPGFVPPAPYGQPPPMPVQPAQIEGSMGLGFLAGFFGGCIGLILVSILAKGPETKKGARYGFIAQMALGLVLRLAAAASQ